VFDVIPILEAWNRPDARFAQTYRPWILLSQKKTLPESYLLGAPDAFFHIGLGPVYQTVRRRIGRPSHPWASLGKCPELMETERASFEDRLPTQQGQRQLVKQQRQWLAAGRTNPSQSFKTSRRCATKGAQRTQSFSSMRGARLGGGRRR
jgi:hypothetical protein